MMDWSLIIELVMAVITGGVVTSLVTMRETKRGMKLDNIAKEEETKNLEIDRWSRLCDDLQSQLAESQNRLDGLNDKLDKKDERIMELEDRCVNYRNKIDTLNTALAKAIMMRCTRLKCEDRKPPFGYTELNVEERMAEGISEDDE